MERDRVREEQQKLKLLAKENDSKRATPYIEENEF
jgi:hypothetical protein